MLDTLEDNMKATIKDLSFWQCRRNYMHIVEDILKVLQVFDGRKLAMGKTWLTMHNLRMHVYSLREAPFNLLYDVADPLEDNFDKRQDQGMGHGIF